MMNGHQRYLNVYTPSFTRALRSYCENGFFERELDADDHEFLERVRVCGTANGDLPYNGAFVLEELGFWHLPYGIDHSVQRRHGEPTRPRPVMIPDAETALRKAQRVKDRALLKQARADALKAWKIEQLAKEERRKRMAEEDVLWEKYSRRPKGYENTWQSDRLPGRHYVPFWKRRELDLKHATKKRRQKMLEAEALEEERLKKARMAAAIERYLGGHRDELTAILEAPPDEGGMWDKGRNDERAERDGERAE